MPKSRQTVNMELPLPQTLSYESRLVRNKKYAVTRLAVHCMMSDKMGFIC